MAASVASVRALEQKVERWMKRVNRALDELSAPLKSASTVVENKEPEKAVEEPEKAVENKEPEKAVETISSSSSSTTFFSYHEVIPTEPFRVSFGEVLGPVGVFDLEAEVTLANTDVTESASAIIGLFCGEECIAKVASSWSGRWDGSETGRGMQTMVVRGRYSGASGAILSLRFIGRHATSVMITHQRLFPAKLWVVRSDNP